MQSANNTVAELRLRLFYLPLIFFKRFPAYSVLWFFSKSHKIPTRLHRNSQFSDQKSKKFHRQWALSPPQTLPLVEKINIDTARKERFWGGFLFSIFTMGNVIGSPTVKCFRCVCENFTTFPFGKRIVGKLDSWAFWRHIQFQGQSSGL